MGQVLFLKAEPDRCLFLSTVIMNKRNLKLVLAAFFWVLFLLAHSLLFAWAENPTEKTTRKSGELLAEEIAGSRQSLSLVKVFFTEARDINSLLVAGICVYQNMGDYAVAEVTGEQLSLLTGNNFDFKILDSESQAKNYYLLWAHKLELLELLPRTVTVLDREGKSLIVSFAEETTANLSEYGFQLRPLRRKPLLANETTIVTQPRVLASTSKQTIIQEMVSRVWETKIQAYIQALQDVGTRYSYASGYDQASEYAYGQFQQMGLAVEYHEFSMDGYQKNNVIATLTGTVNPSEIYVICGHLDSRSEDSSNNAPGAEDNASGSAMVLEAARILSQYEFQATIKFILFGGEEQGGYGADTYVDEMADSGANIAAALNFDMIAYDDTNELDIMIISHTSWQDLAQAIVQAANTYTEIEAYNVPNDSASYSDHWSFWQRNYPAICAIEYEGDHFYPYYHTTEDTIDKLSIPLAAAVAKLAVAALADYAEPLTASGAQTVWYLAEGATLSGFDEWVLIMNANAQTAELLITFMSQTGSVVEREVSVPPASRYSCYVNDIVPESSVSVKIDSTNGVTVIAERSMYWDVGGKDWGGCHNSIGVTKTASTWYLAEGSTGGSFDEWVLVMNPTEQAAEVTATFMLTDGSSIQEAITVPATGRQTIHVNDFVANAAVSTKVESTNDIGIVAERAMYWDSEAVLAGGGGAASGGYAGGIVRAGGHSSRGVTATATTWYLAEGCTDGFSEWLLLMNPSTQTAEVKITFMLTDGSSRELQIGVNANSRYTVNVNEIVPDADVAAKVESLNGVGIIAERSMYWDWDGMRWYSGHNSCGNTAAATSWYFAEGCTGSFDQWLLVLNPYASPAEVVFTFMTEDGTNVQQAVTVAPGSRYSLHANLILPAASFSTKIESTNNVAIIAERSMYWKNGGQDWVSGHTTIGSL